MNTIRTRSTMLVAAIAAALSLARLRFPHRHVGHPADRSQRPHGHHDEPRRHVAVRRPTG